VKNIIEYIISNIEVTLWSKYGNQIEGLPGTTTRQDWKTLGPTLSIFGLSFGLKLLVNARTLTSGYINKMLEHWPQGLQIGFPNSLVSFFLALRVTRSWSSAFVSNLGQIEKYFFYFSLDSWCNALGADFNFCTNKNAWFELNLGLDSLCKLGLSRSSDKRCGNSLYFHLLSTSCIVYSKKIIKGLFYDVESWCHILFLFPP